MREVKVRKTIALFFPFASFESIQTLIPSPRNRRIWRKKGNKTNQKIERENERNRVESMKYVCAGDWLLFHKIIFRIVVGTSLERYNKINRMRLLERNNATTIYKLNQRTGDKTLSPFWTAFGFYSFSSHS